MLKVQIIVEYVGNGDKVRGILYDTDNEACLFGCEGEDYDTVYDALARELRHLFEKSCTAL